jgi:hypothetical protein
MNNLKLKTKLIFILCLLLSASTFAQKKVALVSFYCDKKIGGTGLGSSTESLINDPNFNLKPMLDKAYERFITEYAKEFPFKIEDKTVVSGNTDYMNYKSRFLGDTTSKINKMFYQYAVADGMVFAYPCGGLVKPEKRDEVNLAKIFNTDDGVMFVSLDYEFESRMQGLAAGIMAYMTFTLYDKNGEKVFRIREYAKSLKKVPAVAGVPVMKSEKILPLCEDATEQLFKELAGKLPKIAKKSATF